LWLGVEGKEIKVSQWRKVNGWKDGDVRGRKERGERREKECGWRREEEGGNGEKGNEEEEQMERGFLLFLSEPYKKRLG